MSSSFPLPELTRSLRAFASPSALDDDRMHARFFAPLLDARRAAAATEAWSARLTAFDAERLDATMRAVVATLARERYPTSAPERRALTAQLEDACGALFDAFEALRTTADSVRDVRHDSDRPVVWGAWVTALRSVFAAADRGFEQTRAILSRDTAAPGPTADAPRRAPRARRGR